MNVKKNQQPVEGDRARVHKETQRPLV